MNPVVRLMPGSPLDIDAIMLVMDEAFDPAFGEAWSRGQCLGMMALSDIWLTLAIAEGEEAPCGFALTRRLVEDAELLLLAVRPATRGRGIGQALIERSADEARARGAERLLIEVRDGNPALALYDAAGFRVIGRRPAYYRGAAGVVLDALTLARSIASPA